MVVLLVLLAAVMAVAVWRIVRAYDRPSIKSAANHPARRVVAAPDDDPDFLRELDQRLQRGDD